MDSCARGWTNCAFDRSEPTGAALQQRLREVSPLALHGNPGLLSPKAADRLPLAQETHGIFKCFTVPGTYNEKKLIS